MSDFYSKWFKLDKWTLWEAANLLYGIDPDKVREYWSTRHVATILPDTDWRLDEWRKRISQVVVCLIKYNTKLDKNILNPLEPRYISPAATYIPGYDNKEVAKQCNYRVTPLFVSEWAYSGRHHYVFYDFFEYVESNNFSEKYKTPSFHWLASYRVSAHL